MPEDLKNVDLKEICKLISVRDGIRIGDDFFVIDVTEGTNLQFMNYPFRSDAYFAVYCHNGGVEVEVNLTKYTLKEHSILLCLPGSLLRVVDPIRNLSSNGRFVVVAISKELMSSISIDFKKLFDKNLTVLAEPCFSLDQTERDFLSRYLDLIKFVMDYDIPNRREAVGSLIVSAFYAIGGLIDRDFMRESSAAVVSNSSQMRMKQIFDRFMSLVAEYHTTERGMTFYANRIGLTPKYLSKLVRQFSGRSAPDWIDSFVILEAKNMLKYSSFSIKEIVYKLNFPNPSVFYKFFKSHTGMTPSEYRNN